MTIWLYDSVGSPIAFVANEHYVFHFSGKCIGRIQNGRVWNTQYVGEIIEDRLYYNQSEANQRLEMSLPVTRPGIPSPPAAKAKAAVPRGYRDVYLDEI
jgi:hypothetical protein